MVQFPYWNLCRYRSGKCCVIDWKSQGILFWKTCRNPEMYIDQCSGLSTWWLRGKISEYVHKMRTTTSISFWWIFEHHRSSKTTQVVDVSRLLGSPDVMVGTSRSSTYNDTTLTKTTKHVSVVVHFDIVIIIMTWVCCDTGHWSIKAQQCLTAVVVFSSSLNLCLFTSSFNPVNNSQTKFLTLGKHHQLTVCYACMLHFFDSSTSGSIFSVFTVLHGMQTRSSDENSVCLSVHLSVHHTRGLWQNGKKICPDLYTIRKIIYPSFLRRRMVGGRRPLLREILGQSTPVGTKSPIFNQ